MFRLFSTLALLSSFVYARSGLSGVSRAAKTNRLKKLTFSFVGELASIRGGEQEFEIRAQPAPGSPFHCAFPVHNLELAKHFYGTVLGCEEGRSSEKWCDFSLFGHQIVAHFVGGNYRNNDWINPVDGDEVPVFHMGACLSVPEFQELAERLKKYGVEFVIEPHLRFEGAPGEQWTMFFKDPSGNNLEFKAMTKPYNLFAKYNVVDNPIGEQ